jgi:ELM2 domain
MRPPQKNSEPRVGPQFQAQIPNLVPKLFEPVKRKRETDEIPLKKKE